ncbi:MAG: hypothetical protein UZ17_ACD001001002 [Acidobacteria bacterium OLB17]|nr:MAG: hypothetical protein UZ17_ACD001001002 [Acidobacteria bacterium OLB17]
MIPAIAPEIAKELNILAATIIRENGEKRCEPEIGQAIAVEADIKAVEQSIAENPPVKFDYERRLRVYKSLFQFVDFRFIGGKITSHTITIPPELLNIAEEDSDLRNRIRSTCRLVDESNPFARKFKEFGWKIHKLRKDYTCPLGERYGSIILRKIRPEFDEMVEKARTDMKALTENVAAELQKAIDENRAKLVDLLLPGFKQNPPASLRSRTVSDITEENAREHIQEILSRVIPAASELVGTMQLNCDYKDITYEMLTDKDFVALVKEKFRLDIDALHTEESAAGERSAPV